MTFSKIGNEKCGSLFLRMMNPNTGNAEAGCRIFSLLTVCRSAFLLDDHERKNRLSNQKCHLAGELPTQKRNRGLRFWFSRKGSPTLFNQTSAFVDTFGWVKKGGNQPPKGTILFRKL